jgi:tryptophanyl-tRNA synthetase
MSSADRPPPADRRLPADAPSAASAQPAAGARARVLSGIQPTGAGFHLGNYLGAVRHWAAMQDEFECFYFLADLHALTATPAPAELRERSRQATAELLAMGVDPVRSALFAQSHVPEHAELAWVLGCLTGFGEASRMTQFKDKTASAAGGGNVGLFTYPVLQAADILLYRPAHVPVGEDQRQHLELTRDLAQRFNARYGATLTVPGPYEQKAAARIKDLQDPAAKMSKSRGGSGTLWVTDEPKALRKKVRSAVTDPGREVVAHDDKPGITNLLTVLSVATGKAVPELEAAYAGRGYGDLKADVAEAVVELFAPVRARYLELVADPAQLDQVLADGAERARAVAAGTMRQVRERVGLLPAVPRSAAPPPSGGDL